MSWARSDYGAGDGPIAMAHRGGAGLEPENTITAFARATALGFSYLETDVRVTRDGVAVAFHDASLQRVTGLERNIADTDWSTVRRLRVLGTNSLVERIEDVLACFPDRCFAIDVKTAAAIAPLAAAIRRTDSARRVCVAGGWDSWLVELRARVGPDLRAALGWRSIVHLLAAAEARRRPALLHAGGFVHLPRALGRLPVLRQPAIDLAHELGLRVIAWTIDDPALIDALLDRGVDGVITDRPDVLRERLVARGVWRPPSSGENKVWGRSVPDPGRTDPRGALAGR